MTWHTTFETQKKFRLNENKESNAIYLAEVWTASKSRDELYPGILSWRDATIAVI
jgi:hypothetical protein